MALRGAKVDDQEYVERFGLDPAVANTPRINEVMLQQVYDDNISAGVEEQTAMRNKKEAEQNIKRLLASKGMLK